MLQAGKEAANTLARISLGKKLQNGLQGRHYTYHLMTTIYEKLTYWSIISCCFCSWPRWPICFVGLLKLSTPVQFLNLPSCSKVYRVLIHEPGIKLFVYIYFDKWIRCFKMSMTSWFYDECRRTRLTLRDSLLDLTLLASYVCYCDNKCGWIFTKLCLHIAN